MQKTIPYQIWSNLTKKDLTYIICNNCDINEYFADKYTEFIDNIIKKSCEIQHIQKKKLRHIM